MIFIFEFFQLISNIALMQPSKKFGKVDGLR